MTIEDLNKACDYTPPTDNIRYAWYPSDTPDDELKPVPAGGKMYTAKKHTASLATGVEYPRFYNWDDKNGVTHQSTNETDYIELKSKDEPALVTQIAYSYRINATIGDVLKGDTDNKGWLASQYVSLISEPASVQYGLFNCSLFSSYGGRVIPSDGLRPVVSFNINRLDISDTTKTGTESAPWEIK